MKPDIKIGEMMGRAHSHAFTKTLYLGVSDDIPEFDDDTLVVVVEDNHPQRGKTVPFDTDKFAEWANECDICGTPLNIGDHSHPTMRWDDIWGLVDDGGMPF